MPRRAIRSKTGKTAKAYDHKETEAILRPDIGIQAQFKKKKEPAKYRYDRSLDPQLSWDINADRESAESLIEKVRGAKSIEDARAAAEERANRFSPGAHPRAICGGQGVDRAWACSSAAMKCSPRSKSSDAGHG